MTSQDILGLIRPMEIALKHHDDQRERILNQLRDLCHEWEKARISEDTPLEWFPRPNPIK